MQLTFYVIYIFFAVNSVKSTIDEFPIRKINFRVGAFRSNWVENEN